MGIFFTKPIHELKISDKSGNNMINDDDDVNPIIPEDTDDAPTNDTNDVGDEDNPVIPEDTDDNAGNDTRDEDNPVIPEDNDDKTDDEGNTDDGSKEDDNLALPEDTDDDLGATDNNTDDGSVDDGNTDDGLDNNDDQSDEDDANSDSTPELDDDIISMEKEIFNNLTDEDMAIKNKELKNNYLKLFDSTTSIIDRINNISRTEQNSSILNFSAARITELRQYILDYTTNIYTRRSYIENAINFNQYLAVLSGIKQLLDQIPTIENDLK